MFLDCQRSKNKAVSADLEDEILLPSIKKGWFESRCFSVSSHLSSKGWFITAIAVGSLLALGVGGFGALGLAHGYGLVSLPQWLTSAINAVGQTSHFWSLWAMTAGGLVLGGTLITFGSCKIHSVRKEEKLESERRADYDDLMFNFFVAVPKSYDINIDDYNDQPLNTYSGCHFGKETDDEWFVVIRTESGVYFTELITRSQANQLAHRLGRHTFEDYYEN